MGLARGAFHPPGGNGKEGSPSINGACTVISSILCALRASPFLTCFLYSLFSVRSSAKSGGIATAVLLAESSIF